MNDCFKGIRDDWRAALRENARRDRIRRLHGCSLEQFEELRRLGVEQGGSRCRTPIGAWSFQKNNARRRGIPFPIKLWDWWVVWRDSGHWEQRGKRRGEYVMCRKGDLGAYEVGNVYIGLVTDNCSASSKLPGHAELPLGAYPTRYGSFASHKHIDGRAKYLGTFRTADAANQAWVEAA